MKKCTTPSAWKYLASATTRAIGTIKVSVTPEGNIELECRNMEQDRAVVISTLYGLSEETLFNMAFGAIIKTEMETNPDCSTEKMKDYLRSIMEGNTK